MSVSPKHFDEKNPFPGLRPFEPHDADLFFGREREITDMLGRLVKRHFLAVLGSSGCGKSSLIKAGLIPTLQYEKMDDGNPAWRIAVMRPGDNPIMQLARALNAEQALGKFAGSMEEFAPLLQMALRRSSRGIIEALEIIEASPNTQLPVEAKLLVLVDQFEELFRFPHRSESARAMDEARAFVNMLLDAAAQREWPVYVVITMRSEFLGNSAAFPRLTEAITEGLFLLPDMTLDQLRDVIKRPIAKRNGEIAERLVNRLLNDLGSASDRLPILQHALMRLWTHWVPLRGADPMDFQHYDFIGQLKGSLSKHAEGIYEELKPREQRLAEALFRAITETIDDNRTVRRPTRLGHICESADATLGEMIAVIDIFRADGRSFLMPPKDVSLNEETTIDISHESLIRQWERLSQWAADEVKASKLYGDLKRDAQTWVDKGRNEDWLYRYGRLTEAQQWADAHPRLIKPPLTEFLLASGEMQKFAALIARVEEWRQEDRDESLLLRGKELRKAEEWFAAKSSQGSPKGELKEFVAASRQESRRKKRLQAMLAIVLPALVGVSVIAGRKWREAVTSGQIVNAERKIVDAERDAVRKEAQKQKDVENAALKLISNLEADALQREIRRKPKVVEILQQFDMVDENQVADAASKAESLNRQILKSVNIYYFPKEGDRTKFVDALKTTGYQVATRPRQGNAPTNAIWWSVGVSLDDLKFIAYTLISNRNRIQYIGRSERSNNTIQIGGRPQSLDQPFWTIKQVDDMKELPVNNEREYAK
ncbi:MAG TPA: hypothetical protein VJZ77_11500 [Blastocatellia bacterium]|nr:hypothetical protein [Blastocatellia bacterium]